MRARLESLFIHATSSVLLGSLLVGALSSCATLDEDPGRACWFGSKAVALGYGEEPVPFRVTRKLRLFDLLSASNVRKLLQHWSHEQLRAMSMADS